MLNLIVQYYLLDSDQTRKVVIANCDNVNQAIEKFTERYGEMLARRIVSVTPTNISL